MIVPEEVKIASEGLGWQERRLHFQRQQETFLQQQRTLHQEKEFLGQQAAGFEQERRIYEQGRSQLWRERQSCEQHATSLNVLRERMEARRVFSERLQERQWRCANLLEGLHKRLADLREERVFLRENITDSAELQERYRHLQGRYLEIQQELQEFRQLLCEQLIAHRQHRLQAQADRSALLHN